MCSQHCCIHFHCHFCCRYSLCRFTYREFLIVVKSASTLMSLVCNRSTLFQNEKKHHYTDLLCFQVLRVSVNGSVLFAQKLKMWQMNTRHDCMTKKRKIDLCPSWWKMRVSRATLMSQENSCKIPCCIHVSESDWWWLFPWLPGF